MSLAATAEGVTPEAPVRRVEPATDPRGNSIGFEGVAVTYRDAEVLSDFTLTVQPGEVLALIGPSGSGKTTALRTVAGFVRPSRGRVVIGGVDVTDLPPYERGIGMVVQNYALFPHMRVEDNVAFGLRARGAQRDLISERVAKSLDLVGMSLYRTRFPRELSGGQQQRVAIARALAIRPRVLLLDEPLSALDAQIRRSMVEELARLHRELPNLTVLYVTHDQSEALTLADRIAILRDGRLSAVGASRQLHRRPPNRFAAEFLGRANVLPVTVEAIQSGTRTQVRLGQTLITAEADCELRTGQPAWMILRPHDVALSPSSRRANAVAGVVRDVQWFGEVHNVTVAVEGATLRLISTDLGEAVQAGVPLTVHFAAEDATLIAAEGAAVG